MTSDEYMHQLGLLKIASAGKVGALKGVVAGLLMRAEIGLDADWKDWTRLQKALDEAEAAHRDVVDHLCQA